MKYVAYYRVSTKKQAVSGLGLAAQKHTVHKFLKSGDIIIAEFTEIASGCKNNRPLLARALSTTKSENAILLVANLDRLSRSLEFIINLQQSPVNFIICDCPEASDETIQEKARFAEQESKMISKRTKAALAQTKLVGVNADEFARIMMPVIKYLQVSGVTSYEEIAWDLNAGQYKTRYGNQWTASAVENLVGRYQRLPNKGESLDNITSVWSTKSTEELREYCERLLQSEIWQKFFREKLSGPEGEYYRKGMNNIGLKIPDIFSPVSTPSSISSISPETNILPDHTDISIVPPPLPRNTDA